MMRTHKSKKGQLSIETMILYGLIALVALSAVAALIYFDVLNLGKYLPDTCTIGGSGDVKCEEMRVSSTDGTIELGLRNVGQKPIDTLEVYITEPAKLHISTTIDTAAVDPIGPGEIRLLTLVVTDDDGEITKGQVFEGEIIVEYKYSGGVVTQEASGKMRTIAS